MNTHFLKTTTFTLALAVVTTGTAYGDYKVRCRSENYKYKECRLPDHGYVHLSQQLSGTDCRQGKNWDFDRRHIWVDDGCGAEFTVESRRHTSDDKDHQGAGALAAVAAIAVIAAVANSSNHDGDDKHHDDNYYHGGHSSYIPRWLVGDWVGYNMQQQTEVALNINANGRARATVNGVHLDGYVNDERLYIGDAQFYLDKAGSGFNTTQVGHSSNQVHYRRR
jgi:hypothetical protein